MAKVMVSFPARFLNKVDRAARSQGGLRSELIREALTVTLGGKDARRSWKDALAPLRALEEQWLGQWNSTDIIRYYRHSRHGCKDRR